MSANPLAVPILIDFLDQRNPSDAWSKSGSDGIVSVPCSLADKCMEALIRLTGHNEGYVRDDPPSNREASFDRWIAWWNKEGKAAFVMKHPELLKVYAADGGTGQGP